MYIIAIAYKKRDMFYMCCIGLGISTLFYVVLHVCVVLFCMHTMHVWMYILKYKCVDVLGMWIHVYMSINIIIYNNYTCVYAYKYNTWVYVLNCTHI